MLTLNLENKTGSATKNTTMAQALNCARGTWSKTAGVDLEKDPSGIQHW
jgi:hypothetical protein